MTYSRVLMSLLSVFSFSVAATDSHKDSFIYDLVSSNGSKNYSTTVNPTQGTSVVTIQGKTVKVGITAWSDTGSHDAIYYNGSKLYGNGDIQWEDETVQSATIDKWGQGLAIENQDAFIYGRKYYADAHSIDNFSESYGKRDFDMLLLSFDTAVSLTGASFSWAEESSKSKDITVAGLKDNSLSLFSGSNTWADIAGNAISTAIGHYDISNYQSSFTKLTTAKYWLIGAYNTFFDTSSSNFEGVGFKLSSVTASLNTEVDTPPTEVSEPGALALMSLGLGLVLYRRKRRV
ncbi:MAG: exosortase-dependent surface protein XDP1 [Pseudomonadota bacterium]|nr:exosortase-dependent surface protein XDP1 [Pseudomonadota bacterium]